MTTLRLYYIYVDKSHLLHQKIFTRCWFHFQVFVETREDLITDSTNHPLGNYCFVIP